MKNLIFLCVMVAVLGLMVTEPVDARGGGARAGGGGYSGFSGGRHFGGGLRHFRGGHRGFSGGHRHFFRGGHRHHNRYNFGFNVGYYSPGFFYGYRPYGYYGFPYGYGYGSYYRSPFYSYPAYYYPRTIGVTSAPVIYVQREEVQPTQAKANYWYYCRNPEGYYPYVKKCPEGWLQVAPRPATGP